MSLTYKTPHWQVFDQPPETRRDLPITRRFLSLAAKSIFAEKNISIRPSRSPLALKCYEANPARLFVYNCDKGNLTCFCCDYTPLNTDKARYNDVSRGKTTNLLKQCVSHFLPQITVPSCLCAVLKPCVPAARALFFDSFLAKSPDAIPLCFDNKKSGAVCLFSLLTPRSLSIKPLRGQIDLALPVGRLINPFNKIAEKSLSVSKGYCKGLKQARYNFGRLKLNVLCHKKHDCKLKINRVKIFFSKCVFNLYKPLFAPFAALNYTLCLPLAAFEYDRFEINNLVIICKSVFKAFFNKTKIKCVQTNLFVMHPFCGLKPIFQFMLCLKGKAAFKPLPQRPDKIKENGPVFGAEFNGFNPCKTSLGLFKCAFTLKYKPLKYKLRLRLEKLSSSLWPLKVLLRPCPLKIRDKKESKILILYSTVKKNKLCFIPAIKPINLEKPLLRLGKYRLKFTLNRHSRRVLKGLRALKMPAKEKQINKTLKLEGNILTAMRFKVPSFVFSRALSDYDRFIEHIYVRAMPFIMKITQLDFTDIFLLESQRRIKNRSDQIFASLSHKPFKLRLALEPIRLGSFKNRGGYSCPLLKPARKIAVKLAKSELFLDDVFKSLCRFLPPPQRMCVKAKKQLKYKISFAKEALKDNVPGQIKQELALNLCIIKSKTEAIRPRLKAITPQCFNHATKKFNCRIRLYPYPFGFFEFKLPLSVFIFANGSYLFKLVLQAPESRSLPQSYCFGSSRVYLPPLSMKKPRRFLYAFECLTSSVQDAYNSSKGAYIVPQNLKCELPRAFLFDEAFYKKAPRIYIDAFKIHLVLNEKKARGKAFALRCVLFRARFCIKPLRTRRSPQRKSAGIKRLLFSPVSMGAKRLKGDYAMYKVYAVKALGVFCLFKTVGSEPLCLRALNLSLLVAPPKGFLPCFSPPKAKDGDKRYLARCRALKAPYVAEQRLPVYKKASFKEPSEAGLFLVSCFEVPVGEVCFYFLSTLIKHALSYFEAMPPVIRLNPKSFNHAICRPQALKGTEAKAIGYDMLYAPPLYFNRVFGRLKITKPLLYLPSLKQSCPTSLENYRLRAEFLTEKPSFAPKSLALKQYFEPCAPHYIILLKVLDKADFKRIYSFDGSKPFKNLITQTNALRAVCSRCLFKLKSTVQKSLCTARPMMAINEADSKKDLGAVKSEYLTGSAFISTNKREYITYEISFKSKQKIQIKQVPQGLVILCGRAKMPCSVLSSCRPCAVLKYDLGALSRYTCTFAAKAFSNRPLAKFTSDSLPELIDISSSTPRLMQFLITV